jgi:MFS transporter, MHS family, proline/betaine transporter
VADHPVRTGLLSFQPETLEILMTEYSMSAAAAAAPSRPNQRQVMIAVTASLLGWALDLFDLFMLLYVAPVIGKLFFPSEHAMLSLAAVYASFAVTLLMRPLGSALFGSYADRKGRKGAMIVAVVGVGVATAAFGLLPTVARIGVLAPVLFLALRLVQGVFVGGVVASTHTIGTESVALRYRGAVSGLIGGSGAGLGALLASVAYLAMSAAFPGDSFNEWGWRCMFFTGIVSSVLGLLIFTKLEESPIWKQLAADKSAKAIGARDEVRVDTGASPVRTVFSPPYRSILLVNLLITIGGGSCYYLTSGYLPTVLKVVTKMPNQTAAGILMVASLAVILTAVLVGHLSSAIGRKRTFILTALVQLVLGPWLFLNLPSSSMDITSLGLYVALLSALGCMGFAPALIFLNERFPTSIRATGTGLSWNIGFAIGGMMPTVVSLIAADASAIPHTLATFFAAASVSLLIGAMIVPETMGRLSEAGGPPC